MEYTNINNNDKATKENVAQPDQELKKRPVQKHSEEEKPLENENIEGGEGEEEEESEYEYELSTGFYVVGVSIVLAIIAFIVFINLDFPMSIKCKSWFVNSLVDFKNQFFMKKVYIYAIGAFLFFQVATAISDIIVERINPEATNSNNKDLNDLSKSSMIGAFLILGLIIPIGEELVFRKLIFGILSHLSKILAYAVSSFLFAFYHFEFSFEKLKEEITRFPLYLLAGIMFAYVYDTTGCILSTMIAHVLNNTKTVILSVIGVLKG
jgi:membrane protease YdiL (CAAX protease family)